MAINETHIVQRPTTQRIYHALGIAEAIRRGNLIYISGQVGWNNEMEPFTTITAQARHALVSLRSVLEEAGGGVEDLVELKVFIATNEDDSPLMEIVDEVFSIKKEVFPGNFCAATAVAVKELVHPKLRLEIAAVAVVI